jgi:ribonuclease HII
MSRPTVDELRELLATSPAEAVGALLADLDADPRAGVRALARTWRARAARDAAEDARLEALMRMQSRLHASGALVVAGVDEVGRGALAGPLTVAAVVLDVDCMIRGIDDSKRLAPPVRERIAEQVRARARAYAIVHVEAAEIDFLGIGQAVRVGMRRAIDALPSAADHVLVDGNDARLGVPATAVIGGDRLCACIAAASVIAKVERDALMRRLGVEYPGFGLESHKGYGSADHIAAIEALGPSPVHRLSFSPCTRRTLF